MPNNNCSVRDPSVAARASVLGTCLLLPELEAIAKDAGVSVGKNGSRNGSGVRLLARLHAHFGTREGEEVEWLGRIENRGLARHLEETAFRPVHPAEWLSKPNAWLSDHDIRQALQQYETHLGDVKHFKFVGVFPSDFEEPRSGSSCVSPEMCALNVRDLVAGGVHNLAIVFNLDRHDQPGSHWTACFIGLDPSVPERFGAFYFDSTTKPPLPGMRSFMQRIQREATEAGIAAGPSMPFEVRKNNVRKQYNTTECGTYVILFIVLCIQTPFSYDTICKEALHNDEFTLRMRWRLFRSPKP